jgi:mono/diheme cytochrome c family protein
VLRDLARCVVREGRSDRIDALLERLARHAAPVWQVDALIEGALAGRTPGPDGRPAAIRLAERPASYDALLETRHENIRTRAELLTAAVAWPGKEGYEELEVRALGDAERARFERGRAVYASVCAACHLPSGRGAPGLAPTLRSSPRVLGPAERLARIVLHGLTGPLSVDGVEWNLDMPAYGATDEDLAAVLTYVRREWGHGVEPVAPEQVRAVRDAEVRRSPWTVDELEALE